MKRALFIVLAMLWVAGCGGGGDDGPELESLQSDPLAGYVPPGARLVATEARGESGGGLFGKPTPAVLRRTFEVDDVAAATKGTIAAARDAGWAVEPPLGDLGSTGTKDLPTGGATMSVSGSGDRLTIALEHLQG